MSNHKPDLFDSAAIAWLTLDPKYARALEEAVSTQLACTAVVDSAFSSLQGVKDAVAVASAEAASGLDFDSLGRLAFEASNAFCDVPPILREFTAEPGARKTAAAHPSVMKKRRGRPTEISDQLKDEALAIKAAGGTHKDTAKKLYGVAVPTPQQKRNASTILREHRKKLKAAAKSPTE